MTALVRIAGRIKSLPSGLMPALQDAENDSAVELDQKHCNPSTEATSVPSCIYGDARSLKTIVLIGDSHAQVWVPALEQIANRMHYKLVVLTKAACPAADIDVYDYQRKKPFVECSKFHRFAIARARQLKPNILVLANLEQGIGTAANPERQVLDSEWQTGLAKTLSAIPAKKEYVLGDVPFFGGHGGPACLAAHENDVQACSASEATALAPLKVTADKKAAKQAHAVYINTTPWFCAQSKCYAVIGKFDVFSNNTDHITATYSRFLSRALQAALGLR